MTMREGPVCRTARFMPPLSRLHIVYRSTGGDNPKNRPAFYSKMLCLQSFLQAVEVVRGRVRITFVNDGPMPDDRLEVMRQKGEVIGLPGLGNSPSYRKALDIALGTSPESLIYFAEDDYLYSPQAFVGLFDAFDSIPEADYVTLFDHRDRYVRRDDSRRGYSRVYVAGGRHWRTVESTCMTFGARLGRLKKDAWIHRLATIPGTPRDRLLWRLTQGEKWFALKVPKRRLIGPLPSLATHMDPEGMAPNVDWEQVAKSVSEAARLS